MLLHAVCVMSNHWHGVVTDPEARLPEFIETFHKLLAKVQNATLGRCENFWSSDKTSVVLLVSERDVLDKMAYTLANPTLAGLVRNPDEWPGVISRGIAERSSAEMPDVFFDGDGELPESVTLEFLRPPILKASSDLDVHLLVRDRVAKLVRAAREDRLRHGAPFLGPRAVLRQSVDTKPNAQAPRRSLNPRIAAKVSELRLVAIDAMRRFQRSYRLAWEQRQAGHYEVIFPAGTYALRIFAGVRCAPA